MHMRKKKNETTDEHILASLMEYMSLCVPRSASPAIDAIVVPIEYTKATVVLSATSASILSFRPKRAAR